MRWIHAVCRVKEVDALPLSGVLRMKGPLEKVFVSCDPWPQVVLQPHVGKSFFREAGSRPHVSYQAFDGAGEARRIVRGEEKSRAAVAHYFSYAPHVTSHYGDACGHGFEDADGETFRDRRKTEKVE